MAKQMTVTRDGKNQVSVTEKAYEKVWKSRGYKPVPAKKPEAPKSKTTS